MGLIKNIIGILLIPFAFGLLSSFLTSLNKLRFASFGEMTFIFGSFLYLLIHFFIVKPRFLSTLSHEISHAFWGVLFNAKIKGFNIHRDSGSVNLSKTNFLIILAPYFFPFYTLIVIILSYFLKAKYLDLIYLLVGFTLAFHILNTYETIKTKQSDIQKTGTIFSLPIILILNLLTIVLVLKFINPGNVSIKNFLITGFQRTIDLFSFFS